MPLSFGPTCCTYPKSVANLELCKIEIGNNQHHQRHLQLIGDPPQKNIRISHDMSESLFVFRPVRA